MLYFLQTIEITLFPSLHIGTYILKYYCRYRHLVLGLLHCTYIFTYTVGDFKIIASSCYCLIKITRRLKRASQYKKKI